MGYALKTSGLATALTMCVAVDSDGTIKEFVSSDVNANMSVTGVSPGLYGWNGVARGLFNHANPVSFASGHRPAFTNVGGMGFYVAIHSLLGIASAPSAILGTDAFGSAGPLIRIDNSFIAQMSGADSAPTVPTPDPINTGVGSLSGNYTKNGTVNIGFALDGDEFAIQATGTDTNNVLIAGNVVQIPLNLYEYLFAVCLFNRPLTLTEQQSLHTDWFDTLFDVSLTLTGAWTDPGDAIAGSGTISHSGGGPSLPSFVPDKPTAPNSYYFGDCPMTNTEDSVNTISGLFALRQKPYTLYAGSAPYDPITRRFFLMSGGHNPGGADYSPTLVVALDDVTGGTFLLKNKPPDGVLFPDVSPPDAVPGYPNFYIDNGIYITTPPGWGFVPHTYCGAKWVPASMDTVSGKGQIWYRILYNIYASRDPSLDQGGDTARTAGVLGSHPDAETSAVVWPGHGSDPGGIFVVDCMANCPFTTLYRVDGTYDDTFPPTDGEYLSTALAIDNGRNLLYGINAGGTLRTIDLVTKLGHDNTYTGLSTEPKRWGWDYNPSRDAIIGTNPYSASANTDDLWALVPPASNRTTSPWTAIPLTGALAPNAIAGSATSLRPPGDQANSAWTPWGWIDDWDSYGRFSVYGTRFQLIRPSDNIGPDPTHPTPTLTGAWTDPADTVFGSGSIATASGSTRSFSITLYTALGVPLANATGLRCSFFDQPLPDSFLAPVYRTATATTNSSGVLSLTLTGSALASGAVGWLDVTNSDGNPATAHKHFGGPVQVT